MASSHTTFQVNDLVRIGKGKVIHRVQAVVATGRTPTYDLLTLKGPKRWHIGVPETRLEHM